MTRGASWCGGEREPSCRSLDKREGLWSQGKNPTETFYTCGEKLGKMTVNDFSILLWCLSAGHQTRQNISISITLKTTKVTNFRVLNHPKKKWNSSPSNPPRDPDCRFQGGPHRVASLASPAGHLRAESHPGNTPSAPVESWVERLNQARPGA